MEKILRRFCDTSDYLHKRRENAKTSRHYEFYDRMLAKNVDRFISQTHMKMLEIELLSEVKNAKRD